MFNVFIIYPPHPSQNKNKKKNRKFKNKNIISTHSVNWCASATKEEETEIIVMSRTILLLLVISVCSFIGCIAEPDIIQHSRAKRLTAFSKPASPSQTPIVGKFLILELKKIK